MDVDQDGIQCIGVDRGNVVTVEQSSDEELVDKHGWLLEQVSLRQWTTERYDSYCFPIGSNN